MSSSARALPGLTAFTISGARPRDTTCIAPMNAAMRSGPRCAYARARAASSPRTSPVSSVHRSHRLAACSTMGNTLSGESLASSGAISGAQR